MKILLTGAGGFIGSALAKSISEKEQYRLVAVLRKTTANRLATDSVEHVIGDFNKYTEWSTLLNGIDVVIHTASRAHVLQERSVDPIADYRKTNVALTLRLAECAARCKVSRFIFISSIGVNGSYLNGGAIDENTPYNPMAPYAQSKMEAEIGLIDVCQKYGMEYTIVRPPLVYAADAPGNFAKLLNITYKQLPLPLAGIANRRSFISKSNLVNIVEACISSPTAGNEIFVVSDGEDVSTSELIRLLAQGMGRDARLFSLPKSVLSLMFKAAGRQAQFFQLCNSLYIDNSKLLKFLPDSIDMSARAQLVSTAEKYKKLKISTK